MTYIEDSINNRAVLVKAAFSLLSVAFAIALNVIGYFFLLFPVYLTITILMGVFFGMVLLKIVRGFNLMIWGLFFIYANLMALILLSRDDKGYAEIAQQIISLVFLVGIISKGSNKLRTPKSSLNEIFALNTNR